MAILVPYATEYIFYRNLVTAGSQDYQTNPTLAAGDFKESLDGAAEANLDTTPSVVPAGGTRVKITISAAELTGKKQLVNAKDVAGAEWEMDSWEFETYGHPSSQHPNIGKAEVSADVTKWNGSAVATPDTAGHPKVTVKDGTGQGELNITSGATDANVTSIESSAAASIPTQEVLGED